MDNNEMHKTTVSAVKCDTYEIEQLQIKIKEAIELAGGLPTRIKPGAKILLKPNLLTAKPPEASATTHPEVLRAIIRFLKKQGINDITLGDSPAGSHEWDKLWTTTGMKAVADEENVKLLPFEHSKTISVACMGELEKVPILKELNDFDAVISVPKLKTHLLTKITGAIKNSYGLVVSNAKSHFHGSYPSPKKMSNFIAHLYGDLKPDFVILDAIDCMEGEGPSYGKVKHVGVILVGQDAVAIDACACKIYGYNYTEIDILKKTSELGFGIANDDLIEKTGDAWNVIANAKAKRSKADWLFKIPEKLFFIVTYLARCRPVIDPEKCIRCGLCVKECSQYAITIDKKRCKVDRSKCVLCMCCIETCPYKAIKLDFSAFWKIFLP